MASRVNSPFWKRNPAKRSDYYRLPGTVASLKLAPRPGQQSPLRLDCGQRTQSGGSSAYNFSPQRQQNSASGRWSGAWHTWHTTCLKTGTGAGAEPPAIWADTMPVGTAMMA